MPDHKDDEPIILDEPGGDGEARFKAQVQKHVLGQRIVGVSYAASEDVEGEPKTTIRLDFESGGFFVVAIATDANVEMFLQRDPETPEAPVKWVM